ADVGVVRLSGRGALGEGDVDVRLAGALDAQRGRAAGGRQGEEGQAEKPRPHRFAIASLSSSANTFGLPFPFAAFMQAPVRKPIAACFPALMSATTLAFESIACSTIAASAPRSLSCASPRSFTIATGSAPVENMSGRTSRR